MSVSSQITVRDAASRRLERIADRYARVERAARAADTATNAAGRNTAEYFDRASRSVQNAADNVNDFSRRQQDAERQASMIGDVWQRIKGYIGAAGAAFSISKLTALSDTLSSNKARLGLIVDDGGSVKELDKQIYASAMRARAEYTSVQCSLLPERNDGRKCLHFRFRKVLQSRIGAFASLQKQLSRGLLPCGV